MGRGKVSSHGFVSWIVSFRHYDESDRSKAVQGIKPSLRAVDNIRLDEPFKAGDSRDKMLDVSDR